MLRQRSRWRVPQDMALRRDGRRTLLGQRDRAHNVCSQVAASEFRPPARLMQFACPVGGLEKIEGETMGEVDVSKRGSGKEGP